MTMFENLGKKLSETGKVIGDKTKQVSETAQLNYKITAAERQQEELFAVLGRIVYENDKNNSQSPYYAKCEEIAAKQAQIDELRKKADAVKGLLVCANCGAECDIKNEYCPKCGSKLVKPMENVDVEINGDKTE